MKISFFAKLGLLFIALAGVLYLMQSLDSAKVGEKLLDPDNTLNLLLGTDEKVINWCPATTTEVELYNDQGALQKVFTATADLSSLCETMVGSFDNEGIDEKSYTKRLVAKTKEGESKVLEQIPEKPIFRALGLPFRSPLLLRNIANRASP